MFFLAFTEVVFSEEATDDVSNEIDRFFHEYISTAENNGTEAIVSAFKKQFASSDRELVEELLASAFSAESHLDFLVKKVVWVALAKEQPSEAALCSTVMLSEMEEEIRVKTLTEMMRDSDSPANQDTDWNFDKYRAILKATQEEPFERLLVYAFEVAPHKALKIMLELYGKNIPAEEQQDILHQSERLAANLRQHDRLIGEDEKAEDLVRFLVGLTDYDEWFLDLYVAACLEKGRLNNVSPELNAYFSSKPEELAEKFRQRTGVGSFPMQNLPIEKLRKARR